MGIWDVISGTTNSLKRNAPDLTAAKNLYSTAYGYGSATVTKIDNAVRGNLSHQARSKIARFGKILVKTTTDLGLKEAVKIVPGGSLAYKIVDISLSEYNKPNEQEVDVNDKPCAEPTNESSSEHPKKLPDEGIHGSDLVQNNRKRISIPSRL